MFYFALGFDGNIHHLGDCKDFEEADEKQEKMELDAVWVADLPTAKRWAESIQSVRPKLNNKKS